jgi:hypothetical protein
MGPYTLCLCSCCHRYGASLSSGTDSNCQTRAERGTCGCKGAELKFESETELPADQRAGSC